MNRRKDNAYLPLPTAALVLLDAFEFTKDLVIEGIFLLASQGLTGLGRVGSGRVFIWRGCVFSLNIVGTHHSVLHPNLLVRAAGYMTSRRSLLARAAILPH